MTEQFNYKGYTLEIGDLPGVRQAYWKTLPDGEQNQVECGDVVDLRLIAMRSIDELISNPPPPPQEETHAQSQRVEESEEAEPETEASAEHLSDSDETVRGQRDTFFKRTK